MRALPPLLRSNTLFVLVFLLMAGTATAQDRIYVDTGGNDAFTGTAPTTTGETEPGTGRVIGPVQTVDGAIVRVNEAGATETIISIQANGAGGFYAVPTGGFDAEVDDITFEARNSGTFTQVRFTDVGDTAVFTADDLAFTSAGGTFLFDDADFESGDVDLDVSAVAFTDGAVVEVTEAIVSGTPTYIGSVYLLYNAGDDFTTGALLPAVFATGSTLEVDLDGGGDATLTFGAPTSFGSGTFIVNGENNVDGQSTILGNVTFDLGDPFDAGPPGQEVANAGDIVIAAGGTADFTGSPWPEVDSIFNQGTLDFTGSTLQDLGDFVNEGVVLGGRLDLNGTADAEFAPGPGFTITRLRIGNGPNNDPDDFVGSPKAKLVTFMEDVLLDGNFVVYENATAAIQDFAVTLQGTGNVVRLSDGSLVSTDEDGSLIFAGESQVLQGTGATGGTFGNLTVVTTDDGISIPNGALEFFGTITLSTGGIDIDGGDLSPQAGNTDAKVVVNVTEAETTIDEVTGTFNAEDVDFDLSYFGDIADAGFGPTRVVSDEFDTTNLRDLLVQARGTLDATGQADGSISGDVTLTATAPVSTTGGLFEQDLTVRFPNDASTSIAGVLTVNNDVVLYVPLDNELVLGGNAVINGSIEGDAAGQTLTLLDSVTVSGTPGTNALAAIDDMGTVALDEDANVTITGLRFIDANVTSDGDASLLTLGLAGDPELTTIGLYGGILGAGNVDGDVGLDGGLTLTTDIEFLGDLGVDETLTMGTFDVLLTAPGTAFSLADVGEVVATTGAIAFYGDGSSFDGGGASVPNLRFSDDPRTPLPGPPSAVDEYEILGSVTVTRSLRVNAFVDADSNDGTGDVVITLADGASYIVDSQGGGLEADAFVFGSTTGDELAFAGSFHLFTAAELGTYGAVEAAVVAGTQPGLSTLGAYNSGALAEVGAFGLPQLTAQAENLTVLPDPLAGTYDDDDADSNDPQLNLAGHLVTVSGTVTLTGDNDYVNRQTSDFGGGPVLGRGTEDDPISEIAFVGDTASQLLTPDGVTMLGDGVDWRIAKGLAPSVTGTRTVQLLVTESARGGRTAARTVELPVIELLAMGSAIDTTTPVTLVGGAIAFDDEFDASQQNGSAPLRGGVSEDVDDETLILQSGIFEVGTPETQQSVYVRLDHENLTGAQGFGNFDNGQGFVFADANGDLDDDDATTALTDSYIGGNVRKRIVNTGSATPGRVIFPTGEKADAPDEPDFAPFTFDFESSGSGASFGARQVNVTFVGESPGANSSLPIADTVEIQGPADFYWLVSTTGPAFGQGTTFNIEARSDDFEIKNSTDDIELIRRQSGDVGSNNYSSIGGDATVFQLDLDGTDEGDPADDAVIVQETVATSFLGPQGTIITFGLAESSNPVANEPGDVLPTSFALRGNVPNPFRTRTALSFDLAEAAAVSVDVYDTMGRRVASVDAGARSAGADQRVAIDGAGLASGVYVFRLTVEGATETIVRTGQITLAR